jgi:hypothetical protein
MADSAAGRREPTMVTFLSWTGLLAGIWFLFDKSEATASKDDKLRVARWLKSLETPDATPWPSHFAIFFDRLFGSQHISWRRFSRSSAASVVSLSLVLLIWIALYPNQAAYALERSVFKWQAIVMFVGLAAAINTIPDYLSLAKTRILIAHVSKNYSIFFLALTMASDVVATGVIVLLCAYFATTFLWPIGATLALWDTSIDPLEGLRDLYAQLLPHWRRGDFATVPTIGRLFSLNMGAQPCYLLCVPWGVWTWAAFFSLLWFLTYAVAAGLLRVLCSMIPHLNVEEKPIASLGWVAMVAVSFVYWGVTATRWIIK